MYDAYIIFELPEDVKRLMARYVRDGVEPEELHVTLFSVGWIPKDQLGTLRQVCQNLTKILKPLKAETAGPGIFTNNPYGRPLVMTVDAVGLDVWRSQIIRQIFEAGMLQKQRHGFIPHITLAYEQEMGSYELFDIVDPRPKWIMDSITLSYDDVDGEESDDFILERFPLG